MIAVFGGSKPDKQREALAKKLGCAIAHRDHILLTGGTKPKPGSVKNMAIMGAYPSPWVGVLQEQGIAPDSSTEDPGLVIPRSRSEAQLPRGLDVRRRYRSLR